MDKKKKCSQCDNVKPLSEFYKDKQRPCGYRPSCKGCSRLYYEKNKAAKTEYDKRYRKKNKAAKTEYDKRYHKKNKVARSEYQKQWYQANKAAAVEYQNHYNKERRATDPLFRLTHNIRSMISTSFRNGGFNKKSKTAEILGCSFDEFHQHIEAQFTDGMSWSRFDEIHIDHRLPLSAANTEEEILVLNHHRNLQPMWATDNLAKSDSYCPKELVAYLKKHLPN